MHGQRLRPVVHRLARRHYCNSTATIGLCTQWQTTGHISQTTNWLTQRMRLPCRAAPGYAELRHAVRGCSGSLRVLAEGRYRVRNAALGLNDGYVLPLILSSWIHLFMQGRICSPAWQFWCRHLHGREGPERTRPTARCTDVATTTEGSHPIDARELAASRFWLL
jgi:hypothetical protein